MSSELLFYASRNLMTQIDKPGYPDGRVCQAAFGCIVIGRTVFFYNVFFSHVS